MSEPKPRVFAALESSSVRMVVYLAGVFVSVVVTAFAAGGIWWQLRASMQQQIEILEEIKALRRDMNILDGLMSRFRVQFDERADRTEREHNEFRRRIERLEDASRNGRPIGG